MMHPFRTRKLYDLPEFSGNPEDWPGFYASYNETTLRYQYDDVENLVRLNKALKGSAYENVKTLLIHSANVRSAMDLLYDLYGDPEVLIRNQEMKISLMKALSEEDSEGLCAFSVKVKNMVGLFVATNLSSQLTDVGLLRMLVSKLPMMRTREWLNYSSARTRRANVLDFSQWLDDVARQARRYNALYAPLKLVRPPAKKVNLVQPTGDLDDEEIVANMKEEVQAQVLTVEQPRPVVRQCSVCLRERNHGIMDCEKFLAASVADRWKMVREKGHCFSCLKYGHRTNDCRKKKQCGMHGCSFPHHTLLHEDRPTVIPRQVAFHDEKNREPMIKFRIVPVSVKNGSKTIDTFALFDEGSCLTFMERTLAKELGLSGEEDELHLSWFDDRVTTEKAMVVDLQVQGKSQHCEPIVIDRVRATDKLDLASQNLNFEEIVDRYPLATGLPVSSYVYAKPRILIGLPHAKFTQATKTVFLDEEGPIVTKTPLGWCLFGQCHETERKSVRPICLVQASMFEKMKQDELDQLHQKVSEFMELECFGVQKSEKILMGAEDSRAFEVLQETTKFVNGGYESGLLWKENDVTMPDNRCAATKRLDGLTRRLARDPELLAKYHQGMREYVTKGYSRLLSVEEASQVVSPWYLPHFPVVRADKPKIRIVFDCAAKFEGVSLNDSLLRGPDLNQPLSRLLFQFREGRIGVTADVMEMFPQIKIREQDRHAQLYLWRETLKEPIKTYVMTSMLFGAASSPCTAQYVKNLNADGFLTKLPEAADAVKNSHYVDDYVKSFDDEDTALRVTREVTEIHRHGGFVLRGFVSNLATLSNEIIDVMHKVLGVPWLPQSDEFRFDIVMPQVQNFTRRMLLSLVMSIFDPYGFLACFVVTAKIILQSTWNMALGWDDVLPADMNERLVAWMKGIDVVNGVKIPRCYSANLKTAETLELHVFADASEVAIAAVAYWRIETKYGVELAFINGKTRVAPRKLTSMPRLELQASVLGKRMRERILADHTVRPNRVIMWSDSKTVLLWVQSEARRYRPFVAHRIAELLSATNENEWRYVPTHLNPADDGTRALENQVVDSECRWLQGPQFLLQAASQWPTPDDRMEKYEALEEVRREHRVHTVTEYQPLFDVSRVSKWSVLLRIVGTTMRAVNSFLKLIRPDEMMSAKGLSGELSLQLSELVAAEKILLKQVQLEAFSNEIGELQKSGKVSRSSHIYCLNPWLDEDGLIRLGGRINAADHVPFDTRNPVILPKSSVAVDLLVQHYHAKVGHQWAETVVCKIREKYWIPHVRQKLRSVVSRCQMCKIRKAKPVQPMMAAMPRQRLEPFVLPFAYAALDYFGHIFVTVGRRHEKRWIALFVCLTTRAVHIEIAHDLSTDAFILCLRNFVNIRGRTIEMFSDNGSNFRGFNQEITSVNDFFDWGKIQEAFAPPDYNINWHFNTPLNPSAGGSWERLVQSVKRTLKAIFQDQNPREPALRSALIEAANIVNSRPLTHVPVSHEDEAPITPNHFLIGHTNSTQSPAPPQKNCLRKLWQQSREYKNRFWRRWLVEYLPTLTRRSKWHEKAPPLEVGQLVIICDVNESRNSWPRGRIVEVVKSADGQTRSAIIQTTKGKLKRPANKIAVLDCEPQLVHRGLECRLSEHL